METKLICICCPTGCELSVTTDGETGVFQSVTGNICKRGEAFAIAEFTAPERMMTSVVSIKNAKVRMLPVIIRSALPKEKLQEAMKAMRGVAAEAPVKEGDVILRNVAGTGIDVLAARSLESI